ncbi:MAG: ABC transporter substrate-binding protein [Chloroflexi bacterium]|nr:ABC transporter substrate-binding protein [Chloroflexota bacterium]
MHTRRSLFLLAHLISVLALAVTSCAPSAAPAPKPTTAPARAETAAPKPTGSSTPPAATPKPAADQPRYGGTLQLMEYADPPHLDIHQSTTMLLLQPLMPVYNGIVQYDPLDPQKVVGDLAEKWDISPDGKVYTFNLAKGVRWHDGKAFAAEDARFNLERMLDPKTRCPRIEYLRNIDKIEAPDTNTLKLTLKQPQNILPLLATGWILMLPPHIIQAKGDMKKDVLGTGPFRFKEYASGVLWRVEKNKDYYIKDRPYLDGIVTYILRDVASRMAAFRTGKIHLTMASSAAVTKSQVEAILKTNPDTVVHPWDPIAPNGIDINHKVKPWNDVRVRRAADLAIDRQQAIKVVGEGDGFVGSHFPYWGLSTEELVKRPGFGQSKDADRAEAKRLLAEAGYPNGFKTKMLIRTTPEYVKLAQFHQDQLRTVGIDAAIDQQDSSIVLRNETEGTFELLSRGNARALYDPAELGKKYLTGAHDAGTSGGLPGYSSPRYDELFAKQAAILDPAERKKVVHQMDELLLEESPAIWSMWRAASILGSPKVRNFKPGLGNYNNFRFQDVWLTP